MQSTGLPPKTPSLINVLRQINTNWFNSRPDPQLHTQKMMSGGELSTERGPPDSDLQSLYVPAVTDSVRKNESCVSSMSDDSTHTPMCKRPDCTTVHGTFIFDSFRWYLSRQFLRVKKRKKEQFFEFPDIKDLHQDIKLVGGWLLAECDAHRQTLMQQHWGGCCSDLEPRTSTSRAAEVWIPSQLDFRHPFHMVNHIYTSACASVAFVFKCRHFFFSSERMDHTVFKRRGGGFLCASQKP